MTNEKCDSQSRGVSFLIGQVPKSGLVGDLLFGFVASNLRCMAMESCGLKFGLQVEGPALLDNGLMATDHHCHCHIIYSFHWGTECGVLSSLTF